VLQRKNTAIQPLALKTSAPDSGIIVYAKQNDANSRILRVEIRNAMGRVPIDGTVQLNAQKPDGTFSYLGGRVTDDGLVEFTLTSQLLAIEGEVHCDVSIFAMNPNTEIVTGNGSNTVFTMSSAFYSIDKVEINGVENTNYTYNNSTFKITFGSAPANGAVIAVSGMGSAVLTTQAFIIQVSETMYDEGAIESSNEFSTITVALSTMHEISEQARGYRDEAELALQGAEEAKQAAVTARGGAESALGLAETAKTGAETAETNAKAAESAARAWAEGKKRDGSSVTAQDPQFENFAKWYALAAGQVLQDVINLLGQPTASQIPQLSLFNYKSVNSVQEMLALTTADVQNGDIARIIEDGEVVETYYLTDDQNIDKLSSWVQFATGYAATSGHALQADTASDADRIGGKRIVHMTESQYEAANVAGTLADDTWYLISPDEEE
jgi:hypothetical protein